MLPDDPKPPKRPPTERAWRAAPESPERGAPRARRWRPADPPQPIAVFDAATEQDYLGRRRVLAELVAQQGASAKMLQDALRRFLGSPVLEQVERYDDAERWLAGLIATNAPRSDALIELAIEHFHWDEGRVGPRSLVGARVLARREDLRFLAGVDGVGSPYQGAYAALNRPPSRGRILANRLTPDLARKVAAFLAVIRAQRPTLAASLNPQAAAWWDNHLSQPRLGPLAILGLTVAPVLLAWAMLVSGRSASNLADALTAAATLAGLVGAVAAVRLYALAWPRRLWRRRWAAKAPAWVSTGWAPAAVGVLALAAAIPPSGLAATALSMSALVSMFWATMVGEPDKRQLGQPIAHFRWRGPFILFPIALGVHWLYWGLLRPGVRFPWQVRSLFAFAYLAIFWMVAVPSLPGGSAVQMTLPLIAAAVAFVAGAGTLDVAWQALPAQRRAWALIGLAVVVAAALVALWVSRTIAAAAPIAAGLVCIAVLLHKTPAMHIQSFDARVRELTMRANGLVLSWILANIVSLLLNWWPALAPLVVVAPALLIESARRLAKAASARRAVMLKQIGAALLRYGWVGLVPVALVIGWTRQGHGLLAAGLWVLSGVGVTLAALTPPPGTSGTPP